MKYKGALSQVAQKIYNLRNWKLTTIAFIVTFILIYTYLDYVIPLKEILNGENYLDLKWGGYSYYEAISFFEKIGKTGRDLYFRSTIFDTIWPLCLSICGILLTPLAFEKKWLILIGAFLTSAFGVFDLFENIGIISMLNTYPDISVGLYSYTNLMTIIKQLFIPIGATTLIIEIIFAIRNFYQKEK